MATSSSRLRSIVLAGSLDSAAHAPAASKSPSPVPAPRLSREVSNAVSAAKELREMVESISGVLAVSVSDLVHVHGLSQQQLVQLLAIDEEFLGELVEMGQAL